MSVRVRVRIRARVRAGSWPEERWCIGAVGDNEVLGVD